MNQTKMHIIAIIGLMVAIAAAVAMSILDAEKHIPIIQILGRVDIWGDDLSLKSSMWTFWVMDSTVGQ